MGGTMTPEQRKTELKERIKKKKEIIEFNITQLESHKKDLAFYEQELELLEPDTTDLDTLTNREEWQSPLDKLNISGS
jgi:hypothetical protein